jgi:hypothetical protein
MNCRFLLPALLLLGLVLAGNLEAQSLQAQQPPAPAEEPAKDQPPPLFPKHQRGIYKDNQDIEVIDATPQSPPLEIDARISITGSFRRSWGTTCPLS